MKHALLFFFLVASQFVFAQNNTLDSEGRKQGLWKKFWDQSNTKLQYKGTFVNDRPVGQFWYYYPSGEVRAIIEHFNKRQSYVTYYFENKEIMSEGMYLDQKRDSIWINYNLRGLTVSMEKYERGKLNGKKIKFYLQNQIDLGEIKVLSETYYLDSLKSGLYKELFSSGTVKIRGQYLNDRPYGDWRIYDTKGMLIKSYQYKNGLKHGWVLNYNELREVVHTELYEDGERLTGKVKEEYLEHCKLHGIDPNE